MLGPKVGHDMYLYRGTGTYASPTWGLISQIGDVNIPELNMGLAELKRRANNFVKNLPTLVQSISVEFNLIHGLDATIFESMIEEFFDGTPRDWLILDGTSATSGAQGLRLPALIQNFPWNQPLEEVSDHQIRLACAYFPVSAGDPEVERDPEWYEV